MQTQAQSQTDTPAIEISRLNKWYGTFHVLRDIDLTVSRGERIVIAGPSGSGKSTLIRCINRLEEHQSGKIIVDGTELTHDLKNIDKVRSEVGMVFQHFNLFPHLTILENCTLAPIWVRKIPRREAEETAMHFLTKVKIPDQALKYPGQLSGGQQQRVALARALAKDAPLILLDEPLVNLDYKLREELRDELSALFAEGRSTVVYATTEPGEALLLGGHTAVLDAGELLQYGPTAEVFHRPNSLRVARAFSDPPMNLFPARRTAAGFVLQGEMEVARALPPEAGGDGADITAGLRAGALDVEPRPGHLGLPGIVKLAEISGSDTFVHAETAAGDVVAQLPGVHRYTLDERVQLYFDPAQTYAFGAGGALLAAPGQPAGAGEAA